MTTVTAEQAVAVDRAPRGPLHDVLRVTRLHTVNPWTFFVFPAIIFGAAWVISMAIALIMRGAGVSPTELAGMRYSWAVLSPQWYLIVAGVQAVAYTFPFALGFGSTRRDFWLGTSVMFVAYSVVAAAVIASLVQAEIATRGWGIGMHMFDAVWYGTQGWAVDFYTSFALQMFVMFIGSSVATVYQRWRIAGELILLFSVVALLLVIAAIITFSNGWPGVMAWFVSIGIVGAFTLVLGLAVAWGVIGYFVLRGGTPR